MMALRFPGEVDELGVPTIPKKLRLRPLSTGDEFNDCGGNRTPTRSFPHLQSLPSRPGSSADVVHTCPAGSSVTPRFQLEGVTGQGQLASLQGSRTSKPVLKPVTRSPKSRLSNKLVATDLHMELRQEGTHTPSLGDDPMPVEALAVLRASRRPNPTLDPLAFRSSSRKACMSIPQSCFIGEDLEETTSRTVLDRVYWRIAMG
mmetsp:Transcript_35567/g.70318  ORF Transcript_35567/g.70318 Transcript_35567/m.70318 type:complete len:203 (+) Transcript_35567:71-679(+)